MIFFISDTTVVPNPPTPGGGGMFLPQPQPLLNPAVKIPSEERMLFDQQQQHNGKCKFFIGSEVLIGLNAL